MKTLHPMMFALAMLAVPAVGIASPATSTSKAEQTKPKCSTCGTVVSVFGHSRNGFTMPDKKTNPAKVFKYQKHPSNPAYRGKTQLLIIMEDGEQKNILVGSKKHFRHGDYVQILGFSSIQHVSRKHPPTT